MRRVARQTTPYRFHGRKLSDWGLTHRGLVLRRFDGILRDFADFCSESLNPNRLNPNQFAEFCGFFSEFGGFLRFVCGFLRIFLRNFAESLKPQSAKPQSLDSRKAQVARPTKRGLRAARRDATRERDGMRPERSMTRFVVRSSRPVSNLRVKN